MTTAHLLCKRDHALLHWLLLPWLLLHWLLLHWLLLHLPRGASKPLPRLRVRPRPQWCRQTMMMQTLLLLAHGMAQESARSRLSSYHIRVPCRRLHHDPSSQPRFCVSISAVAVHA